MTSSPDALARVRDEPGGAVSAASWFNCSRLALANPFTVTSRQVRVVARICPQGAHVRYFAVAAPPVFLVRSGTPTTPGRGTRRASLPGAPSSASFKLNLVIGSRAARRGGERRLGLSDPRPSSFSISSLRPARRGCGRVGEPHSRSAW